MTTLQKWAGVLALVAIVIAIGGYFYPQIKIGIGAIADTTNFSKVEASSLAVGATGCDDQYATCIGTPISNVLTGTCNLTSNAAVTASFAATTTGQFYCAISNVAASDNVFVTLPAGAGTNLGGASSLAGGFNLVSAYATTTGILGVTLLNVTGAATSSFTQATTGITYFIIRD